MVRRPFAIMLAALLLACGGGRGGGSGLQVVASLAPLAEIVERVGGDAVDVEVLVAPGAVAHDLEPGPREVEAIADADLVVYLGGAFQPAVVRAVRARPSAARLDVGRATPTVEGASHLWLDTDHMRAWTRSVRDRLTRMLPDAAATIATNAEAYMADLLALDAEMREGLRDCDRRTIVVTHAAFDELAARYSLTQHALSGSEPEAEPDPARLAEVVRTVRRERLTTVFTEPGAPPRVADTLARATGAEIAVLDPLETTAPSNADTYLTRMRANLAALRAGLGCR